MQASIGGKTLDTGKITPFSKPTNATIGGVGVNTPKAPIKASIGGKSFIAPSKTEQKIKEIASIKPVVPKLTEQDLFQDAQKVMQAKGIGEDEALFNTLNYYKSKGLEVEGVDLDAEINSLSPKPVEEEKNLLQKAGDILKVESKFDIKPFSEITGIKDSLTNELKRLANAGRFAVNLPGDTIEFVGDIGEMVLNPIDTAKGVFQLGDALASKIGITGDNEQKQAIRQAVSQSINDNFGSFEKAMDTMQTNPFDTITTIFGGASLAKAGLQKAGASAETLAKLDELAKLSNPLTIAKAEAKLAGNIIKPVVKAPGNIAGYAIGQASGLNLDTLKTIFKNPDVLSSGITRESNANKVLGALDTRLGELKKTGKGYEAMRTADIVTNSDELLTKVLEQTGDYKTKNLTTADQSVINDALAYVDRYSGDISKEDLLSLRQQLDSLKFDPVTGAKRVLSPNGERVVTKIRKSVDELAGEKIEGLKDLDATYSKEAKELKEVKSMLFKKNGELKDNYISTLSNLTSENNLPKLQRVQKLVPEIADDINALKALEDVEFATGNKIGTYMRGTLGGGAILGGATGVINPLAGLATFIVTNPTIVANAVRLAGYGARTVGSIAEKIKNGIKLTIQEAQIVSKAVQSQINEQALKAKDSIGNTLDDLADKTGAKAKFISDEGTGISGKIDAPKELIEEAKKYKSAEEFVMVKQKSLAEDFSYYDDDIRDIQSLRHDLHSLDIDSLFNMESSGFGELDSLAKDISDKIYDLNFTGTEKKFSDRIRSSLNDERKNDRDLSLFDDEYNDLLKSDNPKSNKKADKLYEEYEVIAKDEINDEKENINKIIEEYLGELDEIYDKLDLDNALDEDGYHIIDELYSRSKGDGTFAPSGFARARSILGEGSNNTSKAKRYENEIEYLKQIWQQANK